MREILFKAKRLDNNEWVFGDLVHEVPVEKNLNFSNQVILTQFDGMFRIIPQTVCQYTGLTDKKSVKAFENDKVYDPEENRIFTIKWDSELCRFVFVDDNGWSKKDITRLFYCEVIGNIYDKKG